MMTVIRYIALVIKALLYLIIFIVLLPFFTLWAFIRYRIFRYTLVKSLTDADVPVDFAKQLAGEMSILRLIRAK